MLKNNFLLPILKCIGGVGCLLGAIQFCVSQESLQKKVSVFAIKSEPILQEKEEQNEKKENKVECYNTYKNELDENSICESLIYLGQKYEKEQLIQKAMDCYKMANNINPEKADPFIKDIQIKLKEENERNKRATEIKSLEKSALEGNSEDAYKVAKLLILQGEIDKSIAMFELASRQGHKNAPYVLAQMFEKGEKVPVNLVKAEEYYRMGANNENKNCQYIVAKLIEINAQQNPQKRDKLLAESLKLKISAAQNGHSIAAMEVGYWHAERKEYFKAKHFFEIAKKNISPKDMIQVNLKKIVDYNLQAETAKITLLSNGIE